MSIHWVLKAVLNVQIERSVNEQQYSVITRPLLDCRKSTINKITNKKHVYASERNKLS